MARYPTAEGWVPASRSLRSLARAAEGCRGCDLWEDATHLVFGEGTKRAEVMLVGEQPGDREDLEGRPFVGPARTAPRRSARLRGDRPRPRLRHERSEALQVAAARNAPDPRQAFLVADPRVPPLALGRTRGGAAAGARAHGGDGGPGAARARCAGDPGSRARRPSAARGNGGCHDPPVVHPPRRSRGARYGARAVRRRPPPSGGLEK